MNGGTIISQMYLSDINMENIAEFLTVDFRDMSEHKWVICIPFRYMFELEKQNMSDPLIRHSGERMSDTAFLSYLLGIIRHTANDKYPFSFTLNSTSNHERVQLSPVISMEQVMKVTCFDRSTIEDFFKEYVIIPKGTSLIHSDEKRSYE